MSEPRDPYSIEPEDQPARGSAAPEPGKARIEAPKLLEGFEEDADFDRDPELERVITGKDQEPTVIGRGDLVEPPREEFGKPLAGEPLHWAIAGGVLLLAAMITAGVNAGNHHVFKIALTLYNTLLHTGTGVAAVFIAAFVMERQVRRPELTAARMFVAVAAFTFLFKLRINFFGPSYSNWWIEEMLLASIAYVAVVAAGFRLTRWYPLALLIGAHFLLWLIVQVGMELSAAVAAAPKPPPPPPAAVAPAGTP